MSRKALVPTEFEDLLTPTGRRVLSGRSELCGFLANPRQRFLATDGLILKSRAEAIRRVLEDELRDRQIRLARLETGISQPEAIGLYRRLGYRERGPFGRYRPDPLSLFMEKTL